MSTRFYTLLYFFMLFIAHGSELSAMELNQNAQATLQSTTSPKTLCQFFGVGQFEHLPLELTNRIAAEIVGEGDWWFKDGVLTDLGPHKKMAMSPKGTCFATATYGNNPFRADYHPQNMNQNIVTVWGMDGNSIKRCQHESAVSRICFQDDMNLITETINNRQSNMHSWDIASGLLSVDSVKPQLKNGQILLAMGICLNKLKWLIHMQGCYYLRDVASGTEQELSQAFNYIIVKFNPKKEIVAFTTYSKDIKIFDFTGKLVSVLKHDTGSLGDSLDFKDDKIVAGYANGQVILWNEQGEKIVSLSLQSVGVRAVAFHPTKNQFVTGELHDGIKIWNFEGKNLVTFRQSENVKSILFSLDGNKMISAEDGVLEIMLWQKHLDPTLDQVLLRLLLLLFINTGIQAGKDVILCNTPECMVEWMTKEFDLQEDCVKNAWETMPKKMQEALIRTLLGKLKC